MQGRLRARRVEMANPYLGQDVTPWRKQITDDDFYTVSHYDGTTWHDNFKVGSGNPSQSQSSVEGFTMKPSAAQATALLDIQNSGGDSLLTTYPSGTMEATSIVPLSDSIYTLGSATNRWNTIYANNVIVNGGVTTTTDYTAGENLQAGQPVTIFTDTDSVIKTKSVEDQGIRGGENVFTYQPTTSSRVIQLDSERALVVYNGSSSSILTTRVGRIIGSDIKWEGDEITTTTRAELIRLELVDTNKVLIVYKDIDVNQLFARVITISGYTLTVNTAVQVAPDNLNDIRTGLIDTSKVLVTWLVSNISKAIVLTVSGTTVSTGTILTLVNPAAEVAKIAVFSPTRAVFSTRVSNNAGNDSLYDISVDPPTFVKPLDYGNGALNDAFVGIGNNKYIIFGRYFFTSAAFYTINTMASSGSNIAKTGDMMYFDLNAVINDAVYSNGYVHILGTNLSDSSKPFVVSGRLENDQIRFLRIEYPVLGNSNTYLASLGDSWIATTESLGRGISLTGRNKSKSIPLIGNSKTISSTSSETNPTIKISENMALTVLSQANGLSWRTAVPRNIHESANMAYDNFGISRNTTNGPATRISVCNVPTPDTRDYVNLVDTNFANWTHVGTIGGTPSDSQLNQDCNPNSQTYSYYGFPTVIGRIYKMSVRLTNTNNMFHNTGNGSRFLIVAKTSTNNNFAAINGTSIDSIGQIIQQELQYEVTDVVYELTFVATTTTTYMHLFSFIGNGGVFTTFVWRNPRCWEIAPQGRYVNLYRTSLNSIRSLAGVITSNSNTRDKWRSTFTENSLYEITDRVGSEVELTATGTDDQTGCLGLDTTYFAVVYYDTNGIQTRIGSLQGLTPTYGVAFQLAAANAGNVGIRKCLAKLSATEYVVLYNEAGVAKVAVVTTSGTTISLVGTAVDVTTLDPAANITIADRDATSFVLVMNDPDNSNALTLMLPTVSGTNITIGSKYVVGVGSYTNPVAVAVTTNKIFINALYTTNNETHQSTAIVSDNVPTFTSLGPIQPGQGTILNVPYNLDLVKMSEDVVVCSSQDSSNNNLINTAEFRDNVVSQEYIVDFVDTSTHHTRLDDDRFVVFYRRTRGYARVGKIVGDRIEYGPVWDVTGASISDTEVRVVKVADNKVAFAYVSGSNLLMKAATVSDLALTFGSQFTVSSQFFTTARSIDTDQMADDKIIILYPRDSGGQRAIGKVITFSGLTETQGGELFIGNARVLHVSSEKLLSITALDEFRVVSWYMGSPDSNVIGVYNTATNTLGENTSLGITRGPYVKRLDDNHVLLVLNDTSGGPRIVKINGTTIETINTANLFGYTNNTANHSSWVDVIGDRKIAAFTSTTEAGFIYIGTISEDYTSVVWGEAYKTPIEQHNLDNMRTTLTRMTNQKMVVTYREENASQPVMGSFIFYPQNDPVLGVANSTVTAGSTVDVAIAGTATNGLSGLVVGEQYFVKNGALTLENTGRPVGVATGPSRLSL